MLLEADASQPPEQPTPQRRAVAALVPHDPFYAVRVSAITFYALMYIWRTRTDGLIVDRISVAISVGLFLLCAFVGKPWRRWGVLVIDALLYSAMWFSYEMTRGAADRLGMPLQLNAVRQIDRALFLGYDPNVWAQRHFYHPNDVRWYDNLGSIVYYSHFIVPVVALAVLWAVSRVQWVRFMKRFATVLGVGCLMFVLLPTVPPWMAGSPDPRFAKLRVLPQLARPTGRGFWDLGFTSFVNDWQSALDWGNAVAAMPSLHAGFALFVPAFFLPLIKPVWLKAVVLVFPVLMLASLVYFAEHWIIDGLVGWALVGASFAFWDWFETRQRVRRAARARQALAATA